MSDTYKLLITQQRESQEVRDFVNEWLRTNLDPDCDSLQKLVMDEAGEYIPGEQPVCTDLAFDGWLKEKKETIYQQILEDLSNRERKVTVDVEDPTEPMPEPVPEVKKPKVKKEKKQKLDPRVEALTTLLTSQPSGLTEDDVRKIVKEELYNMINKFWVSLGK